MVASDGNAFFYILTILSFSFIVVVGLCWMSVSPTHEMSTDAWSAIFMAYQIVLFAGYSSIPETFLERTTYYLMVTIGIVIISVLIGLVCEGIDNYMSSLNAGKTKVVETGHTLVLGWNEATARVILQSGFLRRVFMKLNETPTRRLFTWTRVIPSTPVARHKG